jgi:hypothetical protein
MIKLRTLTCLAIATALGVAAMPMAVLADSADDGRIVAHWESIHAPSVPQAVMINARWHAAGEAYFRVDDQADVAAYSLSLITDVDRTAQLKAIDADTSTLAHLDQITSLVRDSAREADRGTLTDARSAAYQIAIWHLTDDLSVDPAHVPNLAIRSAVGKLLQNSKDESDRIHNCTGSQCDTPLSTAATAAALSVKVGSTVDDAALRIAIVTPITMFFNKRQYVNLRINGLGATLCPGEIDRIRVDKPATHNVRKSSCEFRGYDPEHKGDPTTADLPRLIVERISTVPTSNIANNTLIVRIPRQGSSQEIQVNWQFNVDPGMVLVPTGPSSPVITASHFEDTRTATATIDPDDFSSFQEIVQRSILPLFTGLGKWGLVLLALLLVMLLVLKDWVTALANWLGRILRRWWDRGWSWSKRKRAQRKARKADASRTPAKEASPSPASLPQGADAPEQTPGPSSDGK